MNEVNEDATFSEIMVTYKYGIDAVFQKPISI